MEKIELLAPAGDLERLKVTLLYGADAVYLGGRKLGLRANATNFTKEELEEGCCFAHKLKKKVYVTLNIFFHDSDREEMDSYIEELVDCGVDAFIVADLGVFSLAKKYAPNVEIHMSTQTGIVNYYTANVLHDMGAKRVVLARELSLDEIADIRAKTPKELELEAFVHGSMCVSFSGRCLISSYMTGRDANRGDCAQPCRWKYHLYEQNREGQYFPIEENENGTYLYNSRDLCMIEHIPELIKAGVYSLKIEGRAKSAYYVSVTTNAYRHAIDDYYAEGENYTLKPWIRDELDKVSHREYNTGFFFGGEPGQVTSNGGYIRNYEVVAVCEDYADGKASLTQRNKFYAGDELDVLPPSGIPFYAKAEKLFDEWGNEIESAPHAMQKLTMITNVEIPKGSVLRKKRV